MADEIPRRVRVDKFTSAERAIYDAIQAVEAVGADVRLTDAVVLLGAAQSSVADFVDGEPVIRRQIGMAFDQDEACAVHSALHRALNEWPEKFQPHDLEHIRSAVEKVDRGF